MIKPGKFQKRIDGARVFGWEEARSRGVGRM